MATVLDTHRIARRFKDAGVPDAQADVLLETLVEWRAADVSQLASKDDLRLLGAELKSEMTGLRGELESDRNDLRAEMAATRADFRAEMAAMRAEFRAEMTALRTDLTTTKGELRAEIMSSKVDLLKWIIPLFSAQILALMALVVQLALKGP